MTSPHPLAALWQPSNLFTISSLAQSVVTHAAAVIAATDDLEALTPASRFARMSEQLNSKLTPFADHDLDRRDLWPLAAEGKLLVALLNLRACLQHLLPDREKFRRGRGRKMLMVFDPQEVYAKLKELWPVVDRLRALAKEVDQLIGSRLANAATGAAPTADAADEPTRQPPEDQEAEATLVQKALSLILANPAWTVDRYAAALGCHRSTLYRSSVVKAALDARHGSKKDLPKGFKAQDGSLDAWNEDE